MSVEDLASCVSLTTEDISVTGGTVTATAEVELCSCDLDA